MTDHFKVEDIIELANGFLVDEQEAWQKIISRQFAGPPARAFGELIVNFIDSYPASKPWEERAAQIESGPRTIALSDWGEGMSRERLRLLLTLGGSDKRGDESKVGRFGIGFFAIFNPALRTRRVTVTTRCEGRLVTLVLDVLAPGSLPRVSVHEPPEDLGFSTRIAVDFDEAWPVAECLRHARERLAHYPCPVTIDGTPNASVWEKAEQQGRPTFDTGTVKGFLEDGNRIQVLCKYQPVISLTLPGLLTGSHEQAMDLRDYRSVEAPYLPRCGGVIDCSDLRLTIARDSFYCDDAYQRLLRYLKEALMQRLGELLRDPRVDPFERTQIILANQYTLSRPLAQHMSRTLNNAAPLVNADVYRELSEAKVYRLNGRAEPCSLLDIARTRTSTLPVFYAPKHANLRWLGGAFKHDFVVLPPECRAGNSAPDLHDTLFTDLYGDVVNLDSIKNDRERIARLVERGIVHRDALGAQAELVKELDVGPREAGLLGELNTILASRCVRDAVQANLALDVRAIRAGFFKVEEQSVAVSAGLFDRAGRVLDRLPKVRIRRDVTLGLRIDHPLVRELSASADPHRAYYALTFLSHELARSQELLVPDTPAFYFVKSALASDMRLGLVRQLLEARTA